MTAARVKVQPVNPPHLTGGVPLPGQPAIAERLTLMQEYVCIGIQGPRL
jgi:hypothetical protein